MNYKVIMQAMEHKNLFIQKKLNNQKHLKKCLVIIIHKMKEVKVEVIRLRKVLKVF